MALKVPKGFLWILVGVVSLSAGCSISKRELRETAQDYYLFGTKVYESGNYEKAKEAFQKILDEYPDSELRREALLNLADSYYKNEEYEEAHFQYRKFLELYPAHAQADTILYRVAMCSFLRTRPDDRDQAITEEAIRDLEAFLLTYPKSPHFRDVLLKAIYCKNKLAAHELGVAKFYFDQGAYYSAMRRLDRILRYYPAVEFLDEVLFYQAESYFREENREKATAFFKSLISQFPGSRFATQAQERLAKIQ